MSSTPEHDRSTGARTAICCRRCTQPVIKDSTLVQNSRGDPTARSARRSGARRPPRWSAKRRRAPPGSAQRLQVRDRVVPVPAVPGHVRVDAGLQGRDEPGQLVLHGVVAREAELARDLVEGHPGSCAGRCRPRRRTPRPRRGACPPRGCAAPRTSGRGTSTPATSAILTATDGRSFTSRGETRRATTGHARMASARQLSPQADPLARLLRRSPRRLARSRLIAATGARMPHTRLCVACGPRGSRFASHRPTDARIGPFESQLTALRCPDPSDLVRHKLSLIHI